jgi:hypothetical protein
MGEVLEMSIRILFAGILIASLTACGNTELKETVTKVPGLKALSPTLIGLDPNVFAQIDQIGNTNRRAIQIVRVDQNAAAELIEVARQGDRSTYLTGSRRGIVLKRGIITQTQGIGGDLNGSIHANYHLRATGQVFTKVHNYLGGDNRIHPTSYRCLRTARPVDFYGLRERRKRLQPIDEVCRSDGQTHKNIYFLIPGTDHVHRSRQWVSEQIGYLRVEEIEIRLP